MASKKMRDAKKSRKRSLPKAKKTARKAARKKAKVASKTAKKVAKKRAKKTGQPAKKVAKKRKLARKPAAKVKPKPVAAPSHRLPVGQRHLVETDEPRERVGDEDDHAFVDALTDVDEAKELGEEYVRTATSGEEAHPDDHADAEEEGGPFIQTTGRTEFGHGIDASNPEGAEPAGFPTVSPPIKPKLD